MKLHHGAVEVLCYQQTEYLKTLEVLYERSTRAIYENLRAWLPPRCGNILDIGAGLGGIDVMLSRHYEHNVHVTLMDIDGISEKKKIGWHTQVEKFGHYTSFEAAHDFLVENGLPESHITFRDARLGVPAGPFDVIVSLLSWGFHYPVETYADGAYAALAFGGSLIIDIRKGTGGDEKLAEIFRTQSYRLHESEKHERWLFQKEFMR